MQWRNGGKVPEVRKDSGRIDRSLWGRMWREKGEQLNCRLLAVPTDSYNPSLASLHVKHVIVIMDSRFLSGSTHTHTHERTHRGRVYACEPSVCSPRQLTGLRVRGFPLLGRSMHFLSELNSLRLLSDLYTDRKSLLSTAFIICSV